ncbi:MAG: PilZ domain-containing protein [Spirochaetales bacterium]|nr:PilZ domain-containing protein [Spirochaetales bacterium]
MKHHANNVASTASAMILSALAVSFSIAMLVNMVDGPAPVLAIAICASAATLLAGLSFTSSRAERRELESRLGELSSDTLAYIDLAALFHYDEAQDGNDVLARLDRAYGCIHDDIASLQRSAKKFDMFSSDIHFSAHNLSEEAARQSDTLVSLRQKTAGFFEILAETNAELGSQKVAADKNAELADTLEQRARVTRDNLSLILRTSVEAAREADKGEQEVSQTGKAADELEADLRKLNDTAKKESEEAARIETSLAVISDIVERTHILATNASIEAARAGTRGAGFAVIAQEVRTLSASSKRSLEDIEAVLRSVKVGIDDSASLVERVSGSAAKLGGSLDRTRAAFDGIGQLVRDIEQRLSSFDTVFSDQIEGTAASAASSRAAAITLSKFLDDYARRASEYDEIVAASTDAEKTAMDSKRAARVLAQLASYLKAGGAERNRVLRKYLVNPEAIARSHSRKEKREELLYNLDVYSQDGSPLGYLGDLSRSGLQLLTHRSVEVSSTLELDIALPISAEGERKIRIHATVRRVEADVDGYRVGCSIDAGSKKEEEGVAEILRTLAVENLAAPSAMGTYEPLDSVTEDAEEVVELDEL